MKNKRLILILSAIAVLLLIPFIAMQLTDEVNWTVFDFTVMGFLLLGAGFLCEFVMRRTAKTWYTIVFCAATLIVFLLIWAELAVGVFGTPFAGN